MVLVSQLYFPPPGAKRLFGFRYSLLGRFCRPCRLSVGINYSGSTNSSSNRILSIMTNSPIVTIISRAKPNQPRTIADVPIPLLTLPFPKSCAITLAATDAVCCHRTLTSVKTAATKMMARAIWDTGLEGKGLTSRSEPRSSSSSCQPGKVARMRKHMNARIIATILRSRLLAFEG